VNVSPSPRTAVKRTNDCQCLAGTISVAHAARESFLGLTPCAAARGSAWLIPTLEL
jgi:hypothetical protein